MKLTKEDIKRHLEIWDFNLDNIDINLVEYVDMGEYKVATKGKPLLLVDNLQVCVSLFTYQNNFGFASHINTKVMINDDYYLNEQGYPTKLKRIEDLYNAIINSKINTNEPLKICISYGCTPLSKDYPSMVLIYKAIEELIEKLSQKGINKIELLEMNAPEFILNTISSTIILPQNKLKQR